MSFGLALNTGMFHLIGLNASPLYGLSANVAPPPLAAILSIAMILGVDWFGLIALRWLQLGHFDRWPWLRWQALPIGAALLAVVLFPAALLGGLPRVALQPLAIAMALAGLAHGWRSMVENGRSSGWLRPMSSVAGTAKMNAMDLLFWLSVAGLGLLALGPTAEADALDYHVGVALSILNTGAFPFSPEWFTSRLAGSGEVLIALGLAIGAEQFGSLLQYSGVLGVVGIFRQGLSSDDPASNRAIGLWRYIIALSVVSTPVFLAWVASPKPMLLPVAMTTAALMVIVSMIAEERDILATAQQRSAFALVCLLVMEAAVSKMNFLLSGAVVGSIALGYMIRNRQTRWALPIGLASGLLILAPPVFWKHFHFGGTLIDALLTPFPGNWPGTDQFEAMLRAYRDTNVVFPLSLLVPAGPGTVTTVLGLGLPLSLGGLWRHNSGVTSKIVLAACAVAVLGSVLGQRNARFFLEPYLWLLIALLLQQPRLEVRAVKWISAAVIAQSVLGLVLIAIGVVTLTSGALSSTLRERIMERHANGYSVMAWADRVLPLGAHLIVEPRSVALAPRYVIGNDWRGYTSPGSEGAKVYLGAVGAQMPDFILGITSVGERPKGYGCDAEVYAGPFRAAVATRNPFNAGAQYDAWILRLNSHEQCFWHLTRPPQTDK